MLLLRPPYIYVKAGLVEPDENWMVKEAIYGLKESPLLWSKETDKKQTVYITGKDIISNLSVLEPYDIKFVSGKKNLNFLSHSLNYFLPDKAKYSLDYLQPTKFYNYKPKKTIDLYGIDYFKNIAKQVVLR